MAGEIKVLDEKVISQIAAGEVIERPTSVVKELVENSIDAKANKIIIEIEEGGKKSIKVIDDGIGMGSEDVKKAFLRHSTSKITTLRDLESITSLGFRGEALASIAAVAKVILRTKQKTIGLDSGTEIFVEGAKIRHVKDVACNEGTTIIVNDLFYNTPARRKYLKTTRAELAKITDIVTRQALIRPDIFFKLVHNGTEIINAPKASSLLDNMVYIYGKNITREMLRLDYVDHDIKIEGFVSKPGVTRKSQSHISLFINKRYIGSKLLTSAIKEGYKNLIMKNRYPIALVSMQIHPRKIDVNVHPTKLEIRFEDEKKVYSAFVKAIEEALQTKSLIPEFGDAKLESRASEALELTEIEGPDIWHDTIPIIEAKRQVNIDEFDVGFKIEAQPDPTTKDEKTHLPRMSLVGQILNTYIVAQSEENILIIDQHAAHERVLFERLSKIEKEDKKKWQELLTPMAIELNPKQKNFITTNSEILDSLGFSIEHFGGDTYHVRAVPVVFRESDGEEVVYDIIDELVSVGKTKHKDELLDKAMATVACHSAIRGGEELSFAQMKNLLESLYSTKNVYSCPHGRPSILSMSKGELEKRFKRKL
ncbi:MAG: DNA mismatch repair endonuclease MutL [Thermoplasmata archaeon]|nr:MAG: DNA mismatch repair endonuclease MutL [Thermoplasmata archaeon]